MGTPIVSVYEGRQFFPILLPSLTTSNLHHKIPIEFRVFSWPQGLRVVVFEAAAMGYCRWMNFSSDMPTPSSDFRAGRQKPIVCASLVLQSDVFGRDFPFAFKKTHNTGKRSCMESAHEIIDVEGLGDTNPTGFEGLAAVPQTTRSITAGKPIYSCNICCLHAAIDIPIESFDNAHVG